MSDKRAQGRPARGTATVGPKKIVEGLQDALRSLQTNNVTRKDIARFAGVTPALVTYYFPERNTLIEAATVPVIETLAVAVRERVMQETDPVRALMDLIVDILTCYRRDIAIIELYALHRKALSDSVRQDALQDIVNTITTYFDRLLMFCPDCKYNGEFLTNALLGICRAVAYNDRPAEALETATGQGEHPQTVLARAEMIHRMLVSGLSGLVLQGFDRGEVESAPRLMARPGTAAVRDHGPEPASLGLVV